MKRIGGTMVAHNAFALDYCIEQSIFSLLAVCDMVSICESESTDGTREYLEEWASREPKIKLCHAPWLPKKDWTGSWLADLSNFAREKLVEAGCDYHVALQLDEVLDPADYDQIRACAEKGHTYYVHRLNFWKDAWHLVPVIHVCGAYIVRLGASTLPFNGDAENIEWDGNTLKSTVRIFHMGFLRKDDAQQRKGIEVETAFTGSYNPIYDRMATEGRKVFDEEAFPDPCTEYHGDHPAILIPWLKERGRL